MPKLAILHQVEIQTNALMFFFSCMSFPFERDAYFSLVCGARQNLTAHE